jgi:hypothetical protein
MADPLSLPSQQAARQRQAVHAGRPNVVHLSMKSEADAEKQIFDRRMVWQAEFPKRHLVSAFLCIVRIEIDKGHHAIVASRRQLGEGDDVVVPGVEDKNIAPILQRRIFLADAVQCADVILDVALGIKVARLDLLFF